MSCEILYISLFIYIYMVIIFLIGSDLSYFLLDFFIECQGGSGRTNVLRCNQPSVGVHLIEVFIFLKPFLLGELGDG